jgi:hypothetical protein
MKQIVPLARVLEKLQVDSKVIAGDIIPASFWDGCRCGKFPKLGSSLPLTVLNGDTHSASRCVNHLQEPLPNQGASAADGCGELAEFGENNRRQ